MNTLPSGLRAAMLALLGAAALSLMAPACKSEPTSNAGGSDGCGGADCGLGGGGSGGSGGSSVDSCYDCACASDSPCVAICDDTGTDANGNPKLNFCTAGMTNGSTCGQCVLENCGAALADCN